VHVLALLAACSGVGWHLHAGELWSEATGQHTATIAVANAGPACTLDGYPRIVLLDARRRPLAFRYTHRGDQMITEARPQPVRVAHGGTVYFAFNKYRCDIGSLATARFVRVLLPGSRRWLELRMSRYPIIDYCREAISLRVAVSPIVATTAALSRHR
jgi:hypothetical protein